MAYFNYKQPSFGSYLDRRNPPYMNRSRAALGNYRQHEVTGSDAYTGSRFNQVKDRLEEGSVLEDWIPRQPVGLHMMFRKIYLRDAIAGTVVDLFSNLPWGKFYELIGVDDPKVIQMYGDMMEALNIWGEIPMLCREFQIIGRVIGSLSFDSRKGIWDSLVPIDPDQAKIQPLPISGHKPLIDVLPSPAWREFARSIDPRAVELKERLNPATVELLQQQSGYVPLDPMNTLWLARRVNQYDHIGTSLFVRILPAWAYETALWNASLTGVRRRNRSILLISAGIEESWEPTDDEISSLSSLFMQADEDPTGGVIAVRNGVEVSEVRDPTAIWGISQEHDFLSTIKMRALGVSEAYLSGETNVSNMEAARTSLGKNITAFRDYIVRSLFTKQLFPTFARIHNMQKRTQAELNHRIRTSGHPKAYISARSAMDIPESALLIPQLMLEDTLRPEADSAYIELLSQIADKGVPVPLRIWAASAGYDIDRAMAMLEDDQNLKKRLGQLTMDEAGAGGGEGGGDTAEDLLGGGGAEEASKDGNANSLPPKWTVQSSASKKFRNSKLIDSLTKMNPAILANLHMPDGSVKSRLEAEMDVSPENVMVPYKD